jgi:hypothetical protein
VESYNPEKYRDITERRASRDNWRIPLKPDRIFTCAGKGVKGIVTEFRHGLQATIGLEVTFDAQITDVWVMSSNSDSHADGGYLFLLSLGDRSVVLHLLSDASEMFELGPESTQFELSSRTLVASTKGPCQVQVTEQSVVFLQGSNV